MNFLTFSWLEKFSFSFIWRWRCLWCRILDCWFLSSKALKISLQSFFFFSFCLFGYWWEIYFFISYPCFSLSKISPLFVQYFPFVFYFLLFKYVYVLWLVSLCLFVFIMLDVQWVSLICEFLSFIWEISQPLWFRRFLLLWTCSIKYKGTELHRPLA